MTDFVQTIDQDYDKFDKNAAGLANALNADGRAAVKIDDKPGEFHNAIDFNAPDGPTDIAGTPAKAGVKVKADNSIEFIHFGRTYKDRASFFGATPPSNIDDALTDDLGSVIAVRGAQYRAALERESILLAGLIASHRAALTERDDPDKGEGAFGVAMGIIGNLLGGNSGSSAKAEPADLNPFFEKVNDVAKALDVEAISYDITHKAGVDLHGVRATYKSYVQGELDKRKNPPPEDKGLLSSIPLLSSLPPEIGHIFSIVEHMSEKAFDIYVGLVIELTQLMMPAIEDACREASAAAIQSRLVPVFDIWFPPQAPDDASKNDLVKKIDKPDLGPLNSIVGDVLDPINGAIGSVDSATAPVVDFLTRPAKTSPGGKYVDAAFGQLADKSGYMTKLGKTGLGELANTAICDSFGFKIPEFAQAIITRVMQALGDFLRGIYGQLVGLDPKKPLVKAELVAAGREHLVVQIIDSLTHGIGFLDKIRAFNFDLDVFGPIKKQLSGEALYQRGMELLNEELTPHIDGFIALMMDDFADQLEGARSAADGSMTMEVYLGCLPSLYAMMFRKTFFPVWKLMVSTIFKPISDLLNPMGGDVKKLADKAAGIVSDVRSDVLKAKKVIDRALGQGVGIGLGGTNLGGYAQDLMSSIGVPGADKTPDPTDKTFPFKGRTTTCKSKVADQKTIDGVTDLKWRDDEPSGGPVAADPPAAGSADAGAAPSGG